MTSAKKRNSSVIVEYETNQERFIKTRNHELKIAKITFLITNGFRMRRNGLTTGARLRIKVRSHRQKNIKLYLLHH